MNQVTYILAKLFKYVVAPTTANDVRVNTMSQLFKKGIVLSTPAKLTQKDVDTLIDLYGVDLLAKNSTFYKSFQEINGKSDARLAFDQLIHYLSTYGGVTTFQKEGGLYEPSPISNDVLKLYAKQSVQLDVVDIDTVTRAVNQLLASGIALDSHDTKALIEAIEFYGLEININAIKNREFLVIYCWESYTIPSDPHLFLTYLHFLVTGQTMLVKNKTTYNFYKNGIYNSPTAVVDALTDYDKHYDLKELAKVIRPYKKLLLLIKQNLIKSKFGYPIDFKNARRVINKILRLSKAHHISQQPFNVFDEASHTKEVQAYIKHANVYQLIRIYNAATAYLSLDEDTPLLYRIRNGKVYVKDATTFSEKRIKRLLEIKHLIENELRVRFANKLGDVVLALPKDPNFVYAMPTTAKSFIGNVPLYTRYHLQDLDQFLVGIDWSEPIDFDLHVHDSEGKHIGWNGSFRDDTITHTGDMTKLNKHGYAAEFCKVNRKNMDVSDAAVLSVNKFSTYGNAATSNYNITLAKGSFDKYDYVADPDAIVFTAAMTPDSSEALQEKRFGLFTHDAFYFTNLGGSKRVPNGEESVRLLKATMHQAMSAMTLKDFIDIVGFKTIDNVSDEDLANKTILNFELDHVTVKTFTDLLNEKEQ